MDIKTIRDKQIREALQAASDVIDPNTRSSRDYGADVKQWREERAMRGHKKGYNPWSDMENMYTYPTEERHDPKDPKYYISPEEYRKGAYGRDVFALSHGGRAHLDTGGDPGLDTSNPIIDQSTKPQDSTVNYVKSLYQNILGRKADQGGAEYWANQLESGNINQGEMLQQFAGSPEFQEVYKSNPSKAINTLYQTSLGRAPEKEGLNYWVNQAKSGMNLSDMVGGFVNSEEGQNVQDINQLYQDYTGQVPDLNQLQQAKESLSKSSDYNDFIQNIFGQGVDQQGTQVAGPANKLDINNLPQSIYDKAHSMWDTGSQIVKDWMPGLIGQEGGAAGWQAKASTSSAQGPFQFLTGTWNDHFAKIFGDQLGITANDLGHRTAKGGYVPTPLGKQVANLRNDTSAKGKALTMAMGLSFNEGNAKTIQDAGLPLTQENIYSVHFSGSPKLAQAAARNPNAPASAGLNAAQLRANPWARRMTVGQIMNSFKQKLASDDRNQMGNKVIGSYQEARGIAPQTTTTVDPSVALDADKAAWQQKRNAYIDYLVNSGKPITLPPELQNYTPGAGGTYNPNAPTGQTATSTNIGTTLAQQGAGGNLPGTLTNPAPGAGSGIGFPSTGWQAPGAGTTSGASVISPIPGSGVPAWTPQGIAPPATPTLSDFFQNSAWAAYLPYQGGGGQIGGFGGGGGYTGGGFGGGGGFAVSSGNPMGWKDGGAVKDALRIARATGGGAWTRKEGKNPEGGLNEKGRASLRAQGHDIKRPQPEGGARKDSFCSRMGGMAKKFPDAAADPESRLNKSLRIWKCK